MSKPIDSFWQSQIAKHNAVKRPKDQSKMKPDQAYWFETINFGWIISAVQPNGTRKILLRY